MLWGVLLAMKNVSSQARVDAFFDILVERYNEGNHREDVQEEVEAHLAELLEYDKDVHQIIKMMDPRDVLKHYNTLQEAGARINPNKLAVALGKKFAYKHLKELGNLGANVDNVFKTVCREKFVDGNIHKQTSAFKQSVKEMLNIGVKISTIFEVCDSILRYLAEDDKKLEETLPVLQFFIDNGVEKKVVVDWLNDCIKHFCLWEAFHEADFADRLKEFGIRFEDLVDDFVDYCIDCEPDEIKNIFKFVKKNPAKISISANCVIEYIPIEFLKSNWCISDLIDEFLSAGGKIEVLARKYAKDVGYTGNEGDVRDFVEIVWYDDACKEIDFTQFASSVNPAIFDPNDELDVDDLAFLLKRFVEYGVSGESIQKFEH